MSRRFYPLVMAGIALSSVARPAAAADLSPLNWNGIYVGVSAAALAQAGDLTLSPVGDTPPDIALNPNLGGTSFFGGLYAGYNHAFGPVIAGVEADFSLGNSSSGVLSDKSSVPMSIWYAANTLQISNDSHIRLRAGYSLGSLLLYGSAGLAIASTKLSVVGYCPPDQYTGEASRVLVGGTVGAGVEYGFTPNVIGRAEYLFDDYGRVHLSPSVDQPGGDWQDRYVKLMTNTFRVGVSYKF